MRRASRWPTARSPSSSACARACRRCATASSDGPPANLKRIRRRAEAWVRMPGAKLVIRNGGFDGMEYPLQAEETLIGRNPTTDVTLLDENISREHALIVFDPEADAYTIEDLQSTNGTKVNGKGIRSHQLEPGDEIQVGHTRFQFVRG